MASLVRASLEFNTR